MMASGIILAGGASTRMTGDKAFMEVAGRRVIDIQLEVLRGLFEEILVVTNRERLAWAGGYEEEGVRVVAEPVSGKGPLGGILSGLLLSASQENFVLACDMPFIKREAVALVLEKLAGYQVAVPRTAEGLEPLHAAYGRSCIPFIQRQVELGDLKVTDFYHRVKVIELPWEEFKHLDETGRLLMNVNSPEDMRRAAGERGNATGRYQEKGAE